jgi:hypothetical protein
MFRNIREVFSNNNPVKRKLGKSIKMITKWLYRNGRAIVNITDKYHISIQEMTTGTRMTHCPNKNKY